MSILKKAEIYKGKYFLLKCKYFLLKYKITNKLICEDFSLASLETEASLMANIFPMV